MDRVITGSHCVFLTKPRVKQLLMISLEIVSMSQFDKLSALVQEMACCRTSNNPVNKITSLQRPWKVLLSFCKRCVKTSWGRQCVEFSLRPQNDLKKRCAGTLTGRSGDVGLLWWRPGNVVRKFCFHKNFPGTLSESFVSNRIVCLCSVNVV